MNLPPDLANDELETIVGEALMAFTFGQHDLAEEKIQKALAIDPKKPQVHALAGHIALMQGDDQKFYQCQQKALQLSPRDERIHIILVQAQALLGQERYQDALEVLDNGKDKYPQQAYLLNGTYLNVYAGLKRYDETWDLALAMLPSPDTQTAREVVFYVNLINVMIETDKWSQWAVVKNKLRQFVKCVTDEEDKKDVAHTFYEEHQDYLETGNFKGAQIFIDLTCKIMPQDRHYREERKKVKDMIRYEHELFRMQRDKKILPLFDFYAFQWFYEDMYDPDTIEAYREKMGLEIIESMEKFPGLVAQGLITLKKKYPTIYHRFAPQWETLAAQGEKK